MKLEDIKKSVRHALEMELQRAIMNCASVMSETEIYDIYGKTVDDIFGEDEVQSE